MTMVEARYVIFVDDDMFVAPLEESDFQYLADHIVPNLQPLSDEDYLAGPAVLLQTPAPSSYILYRQEVYWCAEWEPGLVVVRFSPDGRMAWTALRSPIPNFGGREPMEEDERLYDEDAENHQYNLVFKAWDAQFDEDDRESRSFQEAEAETESAYQAALAHANELGEQIQARYSDDDKFSAWAEQCKSKIGVWAGEGIRIPPH